MLLKKPEYLMQYKLELHRSYQMQDQYHPELQEVELELSMFLMLQ